MSHEHASSTEGVTPDDPDRSQHALVAGWQDDIARYSAEFHAEMADILATLDQLVTVPEAKRPPAIMDAPLEWIPETFSGPVPAIGPASVIPSGTSDDAAVEAARPFACPPAETDRFSALKQRLSRQLAATGDAPGDDDNASGRSEVFRVTRDEAVHSTEMHR